MGVSPACTLGGKLGAAMGDGSFAELLLRSIALCWLLGGLAASSCELRDPKHEIPKQEREANGRRPPLQQDIMCWMVRRATAWSDSLEAFHNMGINCRNSINAKFLDGHVLENSVECLRQSLILGPLYRRCTYLVLYALALVAEALAPASDDEGACCRAHA